MQQIGIQNMKMIAAVLLILAFALPASSQAITSTADEDGTRPAILTAKANLQIRCPWWLLGTITRNRRR
jgi:hypothetical protein